MTLKRQLLADDSECQKQDLIALVDKVNELGLIGVDEHHELHGASTDHDEYHNPLFHIDDAGYIHIRDLSTYSKKDDYDTPTRLLAGVQYGNCA